jgi:hypothetical protein
MFPALKKSLMLLALVPAFLGVVSVLSTPRASASLVPNQVWFLDDYGGLGDTSCAAGGNRNLRISDGANITQNSVAVDGDIIEIPSNGVLMCVMPTEGAGNINITSLDPHGVPRGDFSLPVCGTLDPTSQCVGSTVNNGGLVIQDALNDLTVFAVYFDCNSDLPLDMTITQPGTTLGLTVYCGPPTGLNVSVTPGTVESNPAIYSTADSLIRAVITDSSGGPVLPGTQVTMTIDRCAIAAGPDNQTDRDTAFNLFDTPPLPNYLAVYNFAKSYAGSTMSVTMTAFDVDANDDTFPDQSEVLAIFHGEGCDPGPVAITTTIKLPGPDLEVASSVNVVGPPAFITVSASPTDVVCGEKSEITVSVTDALNQGVSDNTAIELITNYGGVIGGTGSSIVGTQPVDPLSSATVYIFGGSGIGYLLTSDSHHGPYEVVAASTLSTFTGTLENTPRVTAQVTVNCTLASDIAPTPTPVDSGTGGIRPPNTGEAGLSGGFDNSTTLLVIAGAMIISLGGIVRLRFGRN